MMRLQIISEPGKKLVWAFLFSFLCSIPTVAQNVQVEARTDTTSIKIGQQLLLFLEATHDQKDQVVFPSLPDTFSLMEVVNKSSIDTVSVNNSRITRRQTYQLTSFDSGFHVIQPFQFIQQKQGLNDTLTTRPLLITVAGLQVDTTKAIRDLKGQISVPYTWRDFIPWILGALAIAVLILLIRKYLRNRKPSEVPVKPVPVRPAHEIALEALAELESLKLWQNGNHKAYHSGLSDIIRTFIEHRWQIHAVEMTTDEILKVQLLSGLEPSSYEGLKYLLTLSDQVKFAKMIPLANENELSIRHAYHFVNACKQSQTEKEVQV